MMALAQAKGGKNDGEETWAAISLVASFSCRSDYFSGRFGRAADSGQIIEGRKRRDGLDQARVRLY